MDGSILKLDGSDSCTSLNILKTIKLYTSGWIFWYVKCIPIKQILFSKIEIYDISMYNAKMTASFKLIQIYASMGEKLCKKINISPEISYHVLR